MSSPIIKMTGKYCLYRVTFRHTASEQPETFTVPGNSPEEVWLATVRRCVTARRSVAYECISIVPAKDEEKTGTAVPVSELAGVDYAAASRRP